MEDAILISVSVVVVVSSYKYTFILRTKKEAERQKLPGVVKSIPAASPVVDDDDKTEHSRF